MSPPDPPPAGSPTFSARVVYQNPDLLPREELRGITVPQGVEARRPFFRDLAGIVLVKQARGRRFEYTNQDTLGAFAVGYTDTDLAVCFADLGAAWRRDGDFWRFAGGQVVLTLSIGVYVDERANARGRRRCVDLILTHEFLHVRDEIDIVTNWLPTAALADAFVRANLSASARVPASDFDDRIRGSGDGRGSALERRLRRELYIVESSDRAAALHRSRPQDMRTIGRCMGTE
jgi:hypothetical protein